MTDCKRPFAGPEQVFKYLGRYTHRVGLSNKRLLDVTDEAVTIGTRDGNTATMAPEEFIRRFLMHVLPSGSTSLAVASAEVGISDAGASMASDRSQVSGRGTAPEPTPCGSCDGRQVAMRPVGQVHCAGARRTVVA